ncbi:PAS domain S-box protein [Flavobacterium pectinovorum]|uniref:histidine kinase n=1 Tax=Flavobacterium pectinovorum TaxID=29533 RepID=A0A502F7I4_9FLAO|nr:PAS domain S-box protein [Flavobacterium pectinovorum]TPG45321.1 PAS domain S-box protein [Flavobacterium pectinovorum]
MKTKILIAEQDPADIKAILHELKDAYSSFIVEIVYSEKEYESAIYNFKPDIILSNYSFPSFNGMALFTLKQKMAPTIPFIFVTQTIAVEKAIKLIKIGVRDVVLKANLNTLARKVKIALQEYKQAGENFQRTENVIIDNEQWDTFKIANSDVLKITDKQLQKDSLLQKFIVVDNESNTFKDERTLTTFKQNSKEEEETTEMIRPAIKENKKATEKIDTQISCQEQLHNLTKILDFSMELIYSCDEEGRFLAVNKASEYILGYQNEDLIGKKCMDFISHEDTHDVLNANFNTDIQENTSNKVFIRKDGSKVRMLLSAVRDDVHKVTYFIGRVITEKKNIQKAFETERQRFCNLFSQAPSCMGILKGPDHIFELANELYLQLIGKKNIIGKTVKEVLPELETQGIFEFLDTVYKTGETFAASEMLVKFDRHGNGKLVDVYLNFIYQANRDSDNNIDGILVFANDVTEQVVSRKKIEEREKMYRDLIHKLPVATYSCDREGRITIYNKAAVALWGREPKIGKDLWYDSWNMHHNINDTEPRSLCSLAEALTEDASNLTREIIIERPNGEKRNVLPYPVPFRNAKGQITGAVIVLADITEMKLAQKQLKKSEKKYRYLFDNNPMPMWIIDLVTFKFLAVNKIAIAHYGYSREEFLSMTALDIRPNDDKNHFIKYSDSSEINKSNYNRGKWNHIRKDGSVFPVEIIAHDIIYEGSPARLILSNDITDRTKAEINLEKRNRELLKTNSELDKFVYSVSHDLRSPLTSILGLLSFIETESQEPDTISHAEMIRSSVNRLDDFIKNILNYSRNNRTGLEVEQIPLHKTVADIINSLQSTRDAKGIHYKIEITEEQPFYTDKLRFNTILENLISNAIKYQKKEEIGRYIKITGYSDPENLHLSIADNGIGIDKEYHQKIYEMFFRLSGKKNGSGIGLYIVKDTVEILQGSIDIKSDKGTGTTFILTLKNLKP